MSVTRLADDLFKSIQYISDNSAQNYDNIIVGTIVQDEDKSVNRYDVQVDQTVYKGLYSTNNDLKINDQVYLIKLNNEDTKVVIGGLYYPSNKISSADYRKTFIKGVKVKFATIDSNSYFFVYDNEAIPEMWTKQNFTKLYISVTIKPEQINRDNYLKFGHYGLNLKLYTYNNNDISYEYQIDNFVNSDEFVCNPYLINTDKGYVFEKVIDISNIPNIFNRLQLTKFCEGFIDTNNKEKNIDISYEDVNLCLGYDKTDLDKSLLIMGLEQETAITNQNLIYNDTSYEKKLKLRYINIDGKTSDDINIEDINLIKDAEIRWYEYSFGELPNDEYGEADWKLLDRNCNEVNNRPIFDDKGYYTLSPKAKQAFIRQVNLDLTKRSVGYKAVLILPNKKIVSNQLMFINETLQKNETTESNLRIKLKEYTEITQPEIIKTNKNYQGIYNLYTPNRILENPPFINLTIQTNRDIKNQFDTIIWKIPQNILNQDIETIQQRNNNILNERWEIQDARYQYNYYIDAQENIVYFLRKIPENMVEQKQDLLLTLAQYQEEFEFQLCSILQSSSQIENIECFFAWLPLEQEQLQKQCLEIKINNTSYYYNILNCINRTIYLNYKNNNGSDYCLLLDFLPQKYFNISDIHNILNASQPYLILQGMLYKGNSILDLNNYNKNIVVDWLFPNENNILHIEEIDINSQIQRPNPKGKQWINLIKNTQEEQILKSKFWFISLTPADITINNNKKQITLNDNENFEDYLTNYNILNLKLNIGQFLINAQKGIPINNNGDDTINFFGPTEIYYNQQGKLISNNIQQYSFNINNDTTIATYDGYSIAIVTDNNFLNNNIQYRNETTGSNINVVGVNTIISKYANRVAFAETGPLYQVYFPTIFPTDKNTLLQQPKAFLAIGRLTGGNNFTPQILIPINLILDKYENNNINVYDNQTVIDTENNKITTSTIITGQKNEEDNTYNGWELNKDKIEFYQNGQVCTSIQDNVLTLGPSGENQIIIDANNKTFETEMGKIDFSDLKDIINSIIVNKELSIDTIIMPYNVSLSSNKRLYLGSDFCFNGNEKKIYFGNHDEDNPPYITVNNDKLIIAREFTNGYSKFIFDFDDDDLLQEKKVNNTITTYRFNKTQA